MSAIYSYQGDLFTTSSGVYNDTMCIKGQFSLSTPLEPDSSYEKADFFKDSNFSFSFSDGYNEYSSDDSYTDFTQYEGFEFSITTDDDSKPKLWFIYLRNNARPGEDISSRMSTGKDARPKCFDNATTEQQTGPDSIIIGEGEVHREDTWTITYDTAPAAPKILDIKIK